MGSESAFPVWCTFIRVIASSSKFTLEKLNEALCTSLC